MRLQSSLYNSQCKGSNAIPTIMSSPVQDQAVVDIRATTEAHTDIADVLLSMKGVDIMASLHDIGKATVFKMTRKEGLSLSEIGDVKADKLLTTSFATTLKVVATSLKSHSHELTVVAMSCTRPVDIKYNVVSNERGPNALSYYI